MGIGPSCWLHAVPLLGLEPHLLLPLPQLHRTARRAARPPAHPPAHPPRARARRRSPAWRRRSREPHDKVLLTTYDEARPPAHDE